MPLDFNYLQTLDQQKADKEKQKILSTPAEKTKSMVDFRKEQRAEVAEVFGTDEPGFLAGVKAGWVSDGEKRRAADYQQNMRSGFLGLQIQASKLGIKFPQEIGNYMDIFSKPVNEIRDILNGFRETNENFRDAIDRGELVDPNQLHEDVASKFFDDADTAARLSSTFDYIGNDLYYDRSSFSRAVGQFLGTAGSIIYGRDPMDAAFNAIITFAAPPLAGIALESLGQGYIQGKTASSINDIMLDNGMVADRNPYTEGALTTATTLALGTGLVLGLKPAKAIIKASGIPSFVAKTVKVNVNIGRIILSDGRELFAKAFGREGIENMSEAAERNMFNFARERVSSVYSQLSEEVIDALKARDSVRLQELGETPVDFQAGNLESIIERKTIDDGVLYEYNYFGNNNTKRTANFLERTAGTDVDQSAGFAEGIATINRIAESHPDYISPITRELKDELGHPQSLAPAKLLDYMDGLGIDKEMIDGAVAGNFKMQKQVNRGVLGYMDQITDSTRAFEGRYMSILSENISTETLDKIFQDVDGFGKDVIKAMYGDTAVGHEAKTAAAAYDKANKYMYDYMASRGIGDGSGFEGYVRQFFDKEGLGHMGPEQFVSKLKTALDWDFMAQDSVDKMVKNSISSSKLPPVSKLVQKASKGKIEGAVNAAEMSKEAFSSAFTGRKEIAEKVAESIKKWDEIDGAALAENLNKLKKTISNYESLVTSDKLQTGYLNDSWSSIMNDIYIAPEKAFESEKPFKKYSNISGALNRSRSFHFKNSSEFTNFYDDMGITSAQILQATTKRISSLTAKAELFGNEPDKFLEFVKTKLPITQPGVADNMFEIIMGHASQGTPGFPTKMLRMSGDYEIATMLGGAQTSAKVGDAWTIGVNSFRRGHGVIDSFKGAVKNLAKLAPDRLEEAGIILDNAHGRLDANNAMFNYSDKSRVFSSKWLNYTQLNSFTDVANSVSMQEHMSLLYKLRDKTFNELKPYMQRTMSRNGIKSAEWDILRAAGHYDIKGVKMLGKLEGAVGTTEDAVRNKMLRYIYSELRADVRQGSVRAKAQLSQKGDLFHVEFLAQQRKLTNMPLTQWFSFWQDRIMSETQDTMGQKVGAGITEMLTHLGAGAMITAVKDLGRGVIPDPASGQFWARACMSSGALPYPVEEIVSSAYYDGDLANMVFNGMAQTPAVAARLGMAAGTLVLPNSTEDEKARARAQIAKIARRYNPASRVPFISTMIERWAIDNIQKILDPDAYADFMRREEQLRKRGGQKYWWRPGENLPDFLQ